MSRSNGRDAQGNPFWFFGRQSSNNAKVTHKVTEGSWVVDCRKGKETIRTQTGRTAKEARNKAKKWAEK